MRLRFRLFFIQLLAGFWNSRTTTVTQEASVSWEDILCKQHPDDVHAPGRAVRFSRLRRGGAGVRARLGCAVRAGTVGVRWHGCGAVLGRPHEKERLPPAH